MNRCLVIAALAVCSAAGGATAGTPSKAPQVRPTAAAILGPSVRVKAVRCRKDGKPVACGQSPVSSVH